jgi:TRAP-type mannitol/chloroaromatic compound transport system permease large subunit
MTILLIIAVLFSLLLVGVPVAFALGGIGLGMLILGGFSPLMAPQAILSTLDGFILLAVPLFLLMSNVLLKGGVGRDLFAAGTSLGWSLARGARCRDHFELWSLCCNLWIVSRYCGHDRHRGDS